MSLQIDHYPTIGDLDLDSAILAADLECKDIEETLDLKFFTRAEARTHHDRLVSLRVYRHDLARTRDIRASRRMQESLYSAMISDARAIAAERALEHQAVTDRAFAARINGQHVPNVPVPAHAQVAGRLYDDEHLAQLDNEDILMPAEFRPRQAKTAQAPDTEGLLGPANAALTKYIAALRETESIPRLTCEICFNQAPTTLTTNLDCNHTWCKTCIVSVFDNATKSERSWPARCCNLPISTERVQALLDANLQGRYAAKSIEWSTKNRTYCCVERCSTFIPPSTIQDRNARCPRCRSATCAGCKKAYHVGECDGSPNEGLLTQLAQQNRWQRCPSCSRFIELSTGCNHIT